MGQWNGPLLLIVYDFFFLIYQTLAWSYWKILNFSLVLNKRDGKKKRYTSVSNRHFSSKLASWDFLRFEYSSSSFLFFQRALLFWNHTATCRGSRPSSNASLSFLSDSSLCSFPKFCSSRLTCSALSFLFLLASEAPFSPPLFFLLRRRFGFLLSPEKQWQTP